WNNHKVTHNHKIMLFKILKLVHLEAFGGKQKNKTEKNLQVIVMMWKHKRKKSMNRLILYNLRLLQQWETKERKERLLLLQLE
ncbi:hypothetical protein S83_063164, partial [Arachis hypogaea]